MGTGARPALADGRLFVGMGTTILALDAATGTRLWRSAPGPSVYGTARLLARDGRVFAADGDAAAFDAATGRLLWRQPLVDPWRVANAVDERTVFVGSSRRVSAFDVTTGDQQWTFDATADWPLGGRFAGITIAGDTVYVAGRKNLPDAEGAQAGVIVALRKQDGAILWRWQSPRAVMASDVSWAPFVLGRVLVASTLLANQLFALDRFTGQELWRTAPQGNGGNLEGFAVAGDTIYSGSLDGTASAHDLKTGRLLWRSAKTAASISAVEVCDGRLVVENQGFETLKRQTGERVLSGLHGGGDFIESGPVAANHVFYMTGVVAAYAFRCSE
jgi:outer membrane protein assembly factor BamB